MRIIDKVVADEKIEDEGDREALIIQCCVEEYGYKKDKELCKQKNELPKGIEYEDEGMNLCNKCWSRDI